MVNSCVLGKRKVLQLEDKSCYHHSRVFYISGFLENKITLVKRNCKIEKKSIMVDIVYFNGMQNSFPCFFMENIHLIYFFSNCKVTFLKTNISILVMTPP